MGEYIVLLLLQLLLATGIQAQGNLQNNDNEEDGDYIVWIAVGVGAGLSIVFLVCGIIFCCFIGRSQTAFICSYLVEEGKWYIRVSCGFRNRRHHREDDRDCLIEDDATSTRTENIMMSGLSQTSFTSAINKWEIPVDIIRISSKLGRGEFGCLYDAEMKLANGQLIRTLVKTFEGGDFHKFRYEVETLKDFQHPRVGKMLGIVSQAFPYQLVLELPLNGDLKTFLTKVSKENDFNIELRDLVQMTFDVACGLEYLHSIDHVHSDVAARNCMVTQKLIVKITDYGVGPDLFKNDYCVYKGTPNVPVRWLPPESLLQSVHNFATNVWSYGVLFWELMTFCIMPYLELNNSQVVVAIIEKGRRLIQPKHCPPKLFEFIETCWEDDPKLRPTMKEVCKELDKYLAVIDHRVPQKPNKQPSL